MEEQFYSIELCYYGKIISELDVELIELIPDILSHFEDIECDWYFKEATLKEPHHRLMGWTLSRPLSYYELVEIHSVLQEIYEGHVFIIKS